MKKKLLLLIILFIIGIHSLSSQVLKVVGPSVITQFSTATYTVTLYEHRGSGAYYPDQTWGHYCFDFKGKKKGEHEYEYTDTLVFTRSGRQSIYNNFPVDVIPNPVKIELPAHVCPYGTQLLTNETSPYLQKRFTILDNSRGAKISNTGLLTYAPSLSATIKVRYELFFRNTNCFCWIDKDIQLNPHYNSFQGWYDVEINNKTQRVYLSLEDKNYVNNNKPVELYLESGIQNFSWELLSSTGAYKMSYNKNTKIFSFVPLYQIGGEVIFRFSYNKDLDCTHMNINDYSFTIRNPYSVSFESSSNLIKISKDDNSAFLGRMSTQVDTYKIINALTGVFHKQGQLVYDINEIDVANIPNGIYIVQIASGNSQESYKVSIAR